MLKNLASSLLLTERGAEYYEDLFGPDGQKVNPPKVSGRVVTTIQKAKEVRPLIEKCITIARRSLKHSEAARKLESNAERDSESWKSWRHGDGWQEWNQAIAPAVNARRRCVQLLGDKEAVAILFDEIAPRFEERDGGYTRIMRLATKRLGDDGTQAILEFVGVRDRVAPKSEKPAFGDDDADAPDGTGQAGDSADAGGENGTEASDTSADTQEADTQEADEKGDEKAAE